jgi:GntR family transcriptional regulator/MocR family aminotransferase
MQLLSPRKVTKTSKFKGTDPSMIESITPALGKEKGTPLYTQLYRYIREAIEAGKLPSGSKLPAIRALSQHLGISKNTVETAYGQLVAEGYVESKERGGYLIQPLDELWNPLPVQYVEMNNKCGEASEVMNSTNRKDRRESSFLPYEFRYGDIAFDRFPYDIWKSCLTQSVNDAAAAAPYGILGYGDRLGHLGLREELCDYVYQSRGAVCSPDQIFIGAGTQYTVSLLLQTLGLRQAEFAMEEPGYNGVRSVLAGLDCRITSIPIEADGIHVTALEQSTAKVAYVTPSHQFPLGMVMSIEKRQRLLKWASASDALILEDDYDSEFRYGSRPVPSLKALDYDDRVIYLGTLSKSFLPGARLSYVIVPRRLVPVMTERMANYSCSVSPMIQQAVWLFIKQGHYGRHIRRMRRVYQARYRALTDAVSSTMGERVRIVGDSSGMHILLRVPGRDAMELVALAEQAGCLVYPAAKHWSNPDAEAREFVMLGFGGMQEDMLREGVRKLSMAWFAR